MSQPHGEPCYTAEELEEAVARRERLTAERELFRWTLYAMDTMTDEEILNRVREGLKDREITFNPKDPEELDRAKYPNGFISPSEQQTEEKGYPWK